MTPGQRTRASKADPLCVEAVEAARAALVEDVGPASVGEHVGVQAEGERLVTHYFECTDPGYVGWRWAVTVTRASRSRHVTVNESVLLPGTGALLAPEWVPWSDRLRPGDLGAGDLLPAPEDDPRLVPGYTGADSAPEELRAIIDEFGLGRRRVLSWEGRNEAAERWYDGEGGPASDIARSAPGQCSTCGFLVRLAGPLGKAFGLCANEMSPSDGQVVSFDHGCGAHSEGGDDREDSTGVTEPVFDTFAHDLVTTGSATSAEVPDREPDHPSGPEPSTTHG